MNCICIHRLGIGFVAVVVAVVIAVVAAVVIAVVVAPTYVTASATTTTPRDTTGIDVAKRQSCYFVVSSGGCVEIDDDDGRNENEGKQLHFVGYFDPRAVEGFFFSSLGAITKENFSGFSFLSQHRGRALIYGVTIDT